MERVSKTLSMPDWMAEAVQELADQGKRSFTRKVEVLLEGALEAEGKAPQGRGREWTSIN
jgi:hypothetical protein